MALGAFMSAGAAGRNWRDVESRWWDIIYIFEHYYLSLQIEQTSYRGAESRSLQC